MNSLYQNYVSALKNKNQPSLFIDLEALDRNIQWVLNHAQDKKIRIATKSLRSVEIIQKILASSAVFQGLMTFTLEESLWLRSLGFKDILMGYPTMDTANLEKLALDPSEIVLMADKNEHLDLLEKIAKKNNSTFSICVDLDLSLDLPGLRFGVYRSCLHSEKDLEEFLNHLKRCPHLKLVGAMGYEAQIAGVMDKKAPLISSLKAISLVQLKKRREKMVNIIQSHGHQLTLINGGGTGSLIETTKEKSVTEITIGSAFYAPVLFDNYVDFTLRPAMAFTLPVVRQPEKNIVTALGGGYIASGSTDLIKTPTPYLPEGLSLLPNEGAGEVQTPFKTDHRHNLNLGDLIIMRHAKAGEPCERFQEIHLIQTNIIEKTVKTYRGDGKCFL